MKKLLFSSAIVLFLFALPVLSQSAAPTPKPQENQTDSQADEKNSDLVITANIRARELKFEIVPNPTVEFPGRPARQTVWEADRENLPERVEPGVTYRNIGIRLRIFSRFAEIQRIVLEALDEDTPAETGTQNRQPAENQSRSFVAGPSAAIAVQKTKPRKPAARRPRR